MALQYTVWMQGVHKYCTQYLTIQYLVLQSAPLDTIRKFFFFPPERQESRAWALHSIDRGLAKGWQLTKSVSWDRGDYCGSWSVISQSKALGKSLVKFVWGEVPDGMKQSCIVLTNSHKNPALSPLGSQDSMPWACWIYAVKLSSYEYYFWWVPMSNFPTFYMYMYSTLSILLCQWKKDSTYMYAGHNAHGFTLIYSRYCTYHFQTSFSSSFFLSDFFSDFCTRIRAINGTSQVSAKLMLQFITLQKMQIDH